MRVAVVLALLATPVLAVEHPFAGPWCDETGWDRITISEWAVFLDVQTACPLAEPFPESGVFAGELQCETTLFHGREEGDLVLIDVLSRIETGPGVDGGLRVRFGDGPMVELQHCHTVWPL